MGALLKLVNANVRHMSDLPAALTADPWAAATEDKRRTAELRAAIVAPLAKMVETGVSQNNAVRLFLARAEGGLLDPNSAHVLKALGADGSESTLKRYLRAYIQGGKAALLPAHTGRVRKDYGWEARAVAIYNQPSKPGFADVAWRLRQEGHPEATESRVKRYLKALPATLGEHSPARIGKHLHKLKRQGYQRRSTEELLVGEVYAGDGHTADCYVAHPNTGKPFRPELTAFIDIKSKYVAGWYFTESESGLSTMFALSHAMVSNDHVPAWLYIDRGAGYRNKMLTDEATGWYGKFDIAVIGALPGNPHGKGWIERWFRTVRDKHDKFFADGLVYCGDDMAPEINRRLSAELASGKRTLPSFAQYVDSFRAFLDQYHNEPMDSLGGRTPAQVWAQLVPVPVGLEGGAVMRPSKEATVQRQTVRIHNRVYFHEALALYDAKRVVVEYDIHNDKTVWVQDQKGRLVCEARLVNTIGVLPTSRIEEQRDKRLQGQLKRLERHYDEAQARRADAITTADQVAAIEDLERAALPPAAPAAEPTNNTTATPKPALPNSGANVIDIDVLSWRND
jgi:putative transposase